MKKSSKAKHKKGKTRSNIRQGTSITSKKDTFTKTIKKVDNKIISSALLSNNEEILSQIKWYWLFGEWKTLSEISSEIWQNLPNCDRYAVLIASANVQLGNYQKAREYLQFALDQGCSKNIIAQILIMGVHHTLGGVAALVENEASSIKHFKAAVDLNISDWLLKGN